MQQNKAGNFVCAALPSIWTHVTNTIKDFPEYLTDKSVNSFMKANVDKYLTSIGVVIPRLPTDYKKRMDQLRKGRMTPALIKKYVSFLQKFNEADFLKGTERIIDSGAFSMQVGYFDRSEIPQFIDLYHHEFLAKQTHNYDLAFLFDVAPGAEECPFTSFEDMEQLANDSYKMAYNLPSDVREKLIYVHHFRTPNINRIYKKMLPKYIDGFKHFATGGLVSFSRTGKDIPQYIMYVIPLIHIIQHAREMNLKKFRFHVLGGSEWKEILGHKFLERHVKELFDIDVQITFDSSTLFKTLCLGRYTFNLDQIQKKISKLTLRSDVKGNRKSLSGKDIWNEKSNEEIFCDLVNEGIVPHGMKPLLLQEHDIYNGYIPTSEEFCTKEHLSPTGIMSRLAYTYGMFQLLRLFRIVEEWCEEFVDETYGMFCSANPDQNKDLTDKVEKLMFMFNGAGTFGRNIDLKTNMIANSLTLLNHLKNDPTTTMQECDNIIERHMATDECKRLLPTYKKEPEGIYDGK